MQLWQMDVMGGVLLDDSTELKIVTGLDDHRRFCVAAGPVRRAISKAVCEVLRSSLARYGIPDEILTDNGKVFTGRFGPQPVEVLFDPVVAMLPPYETPRRAGARMSKTQLLERPRRDARYRRDSLPHPPSNR